LLKRNYYNVIDGGRATKRRRYSGQTSNAVEPILIGEPLSIQVDRSEPDNSVVQMPQEARKSRRITGHLPEFGMLLKRGELALPYEPLMRRPLNTRKLNPSGLRSRVASKKSMVVKGAKP
jgi:hypothetical protein